jgi:hypothetical protein
MIVIKLEPKAVLQYTVLDDSHEPRTVFKYRPYAKGFSGPFLLLRIKSKIVDKKESRAISN